MNIKDMEQVESITIVCIHCGSLYIGIPQFMKPFLSDSYLEPKVCPWCNEEATLRLVNFKTSQNKVK